MRTAIFTGLAALALGSAAHAAEPAQRAAVLQAVTDCRSVADSTARLACYDAAAASLDAAEQSGEVVVMDREQARTARREAFGFSMPSISLFSRGEDEEELDRASFKVTSASQDGFGRWTVTLDTGAVWRQTDSEPVSRWPKAGSTVELRGAAMGGFFMKLDGQRAVRATRVR